MVVGKEPLHDGGVEGEAVELADDVDGAVLGGEIGGECLDLHAFDVELDEDALGGAGADGVFEEKDGDLHDA